MYAPTAHAEEERPSPIPQREDGFVQLIEQNKRRLVRICKVYGLTTEDQEDLFQEIVFNIWKALPTFRGQAEVNTWLYRIALNVSLRFARQSSRRRARHLPLDGLAFRYATPEHISASIEKREAIDRLYQCIAALGPIDKSIVTLHLEELSHTEIADVLGMTPNHVAVKIKRIKRKLLPCLQRRIL